jgi:hypothetical protein
MAAGFAPGDFADREGRNVEGAVLRALGEEGLARLDAYEVVAPQFIAARCAACITGSWRRS